MAGQTTNYLFDYPTSTDYVKDGATAIQTLATDVDTTLFTALGGAYPGLRLVKKQTIGSGVTDVTVTGAFSATYDAYKIVITGGTCSGAFNLNLKLGAAATGYYGSLLLTPYTSAITSVLNDNNQTVFRYVGYGMPNALNGNIELVNPFLAKNTIVSSSRIPANTSADAGTYNGFLNDTNSYTAFTLGTGSGATMTGGTIYVYGYGIS